MATEDDLEKPYFDVCKECGKHGHFVVPSHDNCFSDEIATQGDAVEWSKNAVEVGTIDADDLIELIRQVMVSSLPREVPDVAVTRCNSYHKLCFDDMVFEFAEKLPPASFHHGGSDTLQ